MEIGILQAMPSRGYAGITNFDMSSEDCELATNRNAEAAVGLPYQPPVRSPCR